MIICAAGDIHGALDQMYVGVLAFEAALGVRFDWLLHVGDFGVWPDPARVDGATKRHDGAGDFPAWFAERRAAPRPTVFIKGNHEDFVWLDAQPSSEVLPGLHYLRNGHVHELLIELGRREPRRREEHPHDLEVLLLGEPVDPSRRPLGQLHGARLGRRGRGERRRPRPPLAGCAPPLEVHVEERLGEHIDRLRSSTPQVGEALVDLRFVGGLVHGHDTSLDSAEQSSDGGRSWSC